jgi:hypothetical protein
MPAALSLRRATRQQGAPVKAGSQWSGLIAGWNQVYFQQYRKTQCGLPAAQEKIKDIGLFRPSNAMKSRRQIGFAGQPHGRTAKR